MLLVKFIGDKKENGSFICRLAGWYYAFIHRGKRQLKKVKRIIIFWFR